VAAARALVVAPEFQEAAVTSAVVTGAKADYFVNNQQAFPGRLAYFAASEFGFM
jgi:hypothetical protein